MSKFEGITPSFTFIEVNLSELMASYRRETMNLTKPDVLSASVPISRLTVEACSIPISCTSS